MKLTHTHYICIENPQVAPLAGFEVLGVSSSRGTEKIGQFGSGCKHATNVLIRRGENPIIFAGMEKVEFSTRPEKMGDRIFSRVLMNDVPTGFSTEYGELDWKKDLSMALREYISNAFDYGGCEVTLFRAEDIGPKEGCTRIFVPYSEEVREYCEQLKVRFLQFDGKADHVILPPRSPNHITLYRRGVWVTELPLMLQSNGEYALFDYNLDFPIDECRNAKDGVAARSILRTVWKYDHVVEAMLKKVEDPRCWEVNRASLSDIYFTYTGVEQKEIFKRIANTYYRLYPNTSVTMDKSTQNLLKRKGRKCLLVSSSWHSLLTCYEVQIQQGEELIGAADQLGIIPIEPSAELRATYAKVWDYLRILNLIPKGTSIPPLRSFVKTMNAGCQLNGYYDTKEQVVYIAAQSSKNYKVIIEEIAHHLTKANDETRDFQDFAFKVAGRAFERLDQI